MVPWKYRNGKGNGPGKISESTGQRQLFRYIVGNTLVPKHKKPESSGWFLLETNAYDFKATYVSRACGADTAISTCAGLACKLNYKELAFK